MKQIVVAILMGTSPLLIAAAPPTPMSETSSSRIDVRVEASANAKAGLAEPCKVAQSTGRNALASWSTFGKAQPKKGETGYELVADSLRCGAGTFADALPQSQAEGTPFLIVETSTTPRWDPGPMDPGPVPIVAIVLAMTSRQLTGFSSEGNPLYRAPVTDHRTIRLGEGEEFALPVTIGDAGDRRRLGVDGLFLRIRAGQAGRPNATEYGALAVMAAAPGSDIQVDGGVAGRVGSDGNALLPTLTVGQHEIRVRGASSTNVMRVVTVVKGRTVVVSPDTTNANAPALFTPAGKNSLGFTEFRRARDGAVMIEIPAGEFVMGNLETEGKPQPHPVSVSAFLMDKLPVTLGDFKRFAAATGWALPPQPYWGEHDDFPVAFVRWDEGRAYCEWAGARLPTEAEREKAARGTDGRLFPWGNEPPSPERGVFRRNWGYEGNDTVGIRPAGASPYGLLDTGGNMWEWCEDWYDPDYYKSSPRQDPTGPRTGRAHVVRGGSWDSRPTVLSASCRNWGYVGYREGDFGFRCAADPPR